MLELTREIQQSVIIDNNIIITLVDIRGDQCRLGITAPPEVVVWREELIRDAQRERDEFDARMRGLGWVADES